MQNVFLGSCFVISIVSALILGRMEELSLAIMQGAKASVELVISLCSVMAFWQGILALAQKNGVCGGISKLLYPLLRLIFPKLSKNSEEIKLISMNITANMLGIGNASTPFGLAAVSLLNEKKRFREMEVFVLINTASVQIIPTTAAILRKECGSANPFSIIPVVSAVSLLSLVFALFIYKLIK